ncbi:DNA-binding NarL/FixJ family response regulator [Wenyingzhuangia heitensis]|uniref:DNA-binding NarL/FixJ family response regulator n=1 Tax=Wenyingzhuangia heitensis TaxID=1487859 RepID=A0ABX0U939_9FLAO|nr:response regulator transcription factor [Wenyingzhuangia heitensis]NIJ43577.1 DNA-binding NarL/FixJ family response regulator [Wenyingzhuangia heitensis]
MKKIYKIIIADDNKFFSDALESYLNNFEDFKVIATCNTINETISYTNSTNFEVLILDLSFNGKRSLDFLNQIRPNPTLFKTICLTSFNNCIIKDEAISYGVDYFMGKNTDLISFPDVIRNLLTAHKPNNNTNNSTDTKANLTLRQIEIIKACFEFSTEKEIAHYLDISINTLKTHKQHLFNKTCAKNNLELIKYGIKEGIIII